MPVNKKYMVFIFSFLFGVYLFTTIILSLLTTINSMAQYPLYNFLGSENSLETAVLYLFPAQNPYYLQQWNSAPALYLLFSLALFVLFVLYLVHLSKDILRTDRQRFIILFSSTVVIAGFVFFPQYRSLVEFFSSFFQ
ncbi:MAG: hypothetical protein B5M52_00630 [Helicobacteraceae bacterium 4484_230]|nr:MAG: hypothetical protein B5M52_00630 [Helicobacteraceae bacterium 4484_230]